MPSLPLERLPDVLQLLARHLRSPRSTIRRDALGCLLGLHGLRISEACQLKREQVDLGKLQIYVATLKGGPPRWLPITAELAAALRNHLEEHASDFVLSTRSGQPLDSRNLRRRWKEWIIPLVGNFRFHDLRHTTAKEMQRRGADVFAIQHILRHANPANTLLYLRTQQDFQRWLPATDSPSSS